MGHVCILCGVREPKATNVTFHIFPKDMSRRKNWLEACNLEETDIQSKSTPFLCSRHFREIDFDDRAWPKRQLLKNAVPAPSNVYTKNNSNHETTVENEAVSSTITQPQRPDVSHETNIQSQYEAGPSTPKKRKISNAIDEPRYVGDLNEHHFMTTPRRAKRHLNLVCKTVESQRKKIIDLQRKKTRLEHKVNSFKALLLELRDQHLVSEETKNRLMEDCPAELEAIIDRQLCSRNRKFDPDLRAFAITLHFYSPRAYKFVRAKFNNLLPHPETLRKWYSGVDGNPGFTSQAFEAIKSLCTGCQGTAEPQSVIVNLTIDEMSIREMEEWRNGKWHGHIDLGLNFEDKGDFKETAKNALVFMAVCTNSNWKIPLGYFLLNGLSGSVRAGLLTTCLELLYETGAECYSITFDGALVNIAMCTHLGANYDLGKFQPYFLHPVTQEKVLTFFDAVHMLKLTRNVMGDHVLESPEGKEINFQHLVALHNMQKKEGLHAACKLSDRHIHYHNEKMKVKLAAQTLSASVSTALHFCCDLGIPEFQNVEGTAEYCQTINDVFDILNCRNVKSKSVYSKPLSPINYEVFQNKIYKCVEYLKNVKNRRGDKIINMKQKTGFLGFVVCLHNLLNLYDLLIVTGKMKYLLTYKWSQDHLETFFSAIRSRSGNNNNPSAFQFKSAYKRLLIHNKITASEYGNCIILDSTSILFVGSGSKSKTCDTIADENLEFEEEEYLYFSLLHLSSFVEEVVKYIAGFVVRKLLKKLECQMCLSQLQSTTPTSLLTTMKNRGKLIMASQDVITICIRTEQCFCAYENKITTKKHFLEFLSILVLEKSVNTFSSVSYVDHIKNQEILNNHRTQIIKLIVSIYGTLRIHHLLKLKGSSHVKVRQKLTKLILFKNQ